MKNIIYIIGIIVVIAATVISFLNGEKHIKATQETYELAGVNDKLEDDIDAREGDNLPKPEAYLNEGENVIGSNPGEKLRNSIGLLRQRTLVANSDPLTFSADTVNSTYEREVDGKKLKFLPLNKMTSSEDATQFEQQVEFINTEATDQITGEAISFSASELDERLGLYLEKTLATDIADINGNITDNKNQVAELDDEIKEYVDAEKKISSMFVVEGINDLQGGKDKLVELEDKRRSLLDEQDVLGKEQESLTEKRNINTEKLATQTSYFDKRKVTIGGNSKKFKIAASDFDWGFVIVETDNVGGFFINQDLYVLRGGHYVGTVKVTGVEPGRIMANILYDTVGQGIAFRKGDTVIPAQPIDR
ncbi:hypothetical protein OAB00_02565 [Akkermansiaceae bacterium]|nr:hypothetical protein [Akkermansiaceae bacterium]